MSRDGLPAPMAAIRLACRLGWPVETSSRIPAKIEGRFAVFDGDARELARFPSRCLRSRNSPDEC